MTTTEPVTISEPATTIPTPGAPPKVRITLTRIRQIALAAESLHKASSRFQSLIADLTRGRSADDSRLVGCLASALALAEQGKNDAAADLVDAVAAEFNSLHA